jgi:subtilase family serine protease/Tol biopolymer transport system component/flagellar hook assembly protein FlgD/fibronectin type 3 domain-containing protein
MKQLALLRFDALRLFSVALSLFFSTFLIAPLSHAQDFTARHLGDYGNVTVMESSGFYDARNPDGTNNVAPRQTITTEFFKTHKDEYDFIVIFSNFDFKMPESEARAFYSSIKNDVRGIGQQIFDNSALYGSNGKLQGTIDMGNIANNVSDPLNPAFERTLDTLAHEMLHRWGSYVRFTDATGNLSSALIGKDNSHWSYLLDTQGSLEYGNQWLSNGNSTFTSGFNRKYYSPLDLYLMGVIDKSKVPPMLLVDNPATDPAKMPETGVTISGSARYVSIDDIIAAEGERVPNAKDSQKQFKVAFIFVTTPGTFTGQELYGIENIRNSYLSRYSILTDGKVLVQVASTPKDNLPVNQGVRPPTTVPRILPPNIDDGVKWLAAHQMTDGSWTDFALTTELDTAEAVTTLQTFPMARQQFLAGLQWLGTSASANSDFLARRLEATIQAGGDGAALQSELLARRNPDGGWGSGRNFISNPTDTALALKELARAGYSDQSVIVSALTYLQTNQQGDGGWSGDDRVSTIQPTATVLVAFNSFRKSYSLESSINRAIVFLAGKQNPDGGFGNSPSTVYDSAVAIMALQSAGADKEMVSRGAAYLTGLQTESGSWQESPFQTALAVRAVWQTTVDPDLAIKSTDISFVPEKVTSLPTNAVVNAVIWNLGRSDVQQARVVIYDGAVAPDKKVGEQTVAFPGMSPTTVTFSVPIIDGNGHAFIVVVDPDSLVKESNKNNNSARKTLLPEVTYDFEVLPNDVTVSPNPVDIFQDMIIGVTIRNRGTSDAFNVPVRLYLDGAAPLDIATVGVDIPAGGSASKNVTWKASKAGVDMPLSVMVDPLNTIAEASEDNNRASVPVTINGSSLPNLTVSYKDILVTPNQINEGGGARVAIVINNEGFSDAVNVEVAFYRGAASTGGTLLGMRVLPLVAAGQSVQTAIDWTGIDKAGPSVVSVQLDPDNKIAEARKDDNFAFTTVNILTIPDLVIANNSITFNPSAPKEGDSVAIAVTVQNKGEQDATDVTIRISEGGTIRGNVLIPVVKGNSEATATVTLVNVLKGEHQLIVGVDPDNRILEQNKENNTASKSFIAQNANLWVSEPFFSPNGDGVKDTTQLSFILNATATVRVVIANNNSQVVRTFSGGELDGTSGTVITWDGRDDNGLLMPDGIYMIKISDAINGILLGDTTVHLDTNRSTLLEAIESNSILYTKIISNLTSIGSWTWLADDSGLVVNVLGGNQDFPLGLYFFSSDGQDAYRLIPGEMGSIGSFDVSPTTGKIAAVLSKSSKQPTSTQWTMQSFIVVTDVDGANLKQLVSYTTNYRIGYQGAAWVAQDMYCDLGPLKWSNDGTKLMYSLSTYKKIAEYFNYQQYTKDRFELWVAENDVESHVRVDSLSNPSGNFAVSNLSWSLDDTRLVLSTSDMNCRVIDIKFNNGTKIYNNDYSVITQLFWFNNTSFFVITQNSTTYPTRRAISLVDIVKNTMTKLGEQSTLHWKNFRGPYISPDRTRFSFTTEDDLYTTSLKIQTADGTTTTVYKLHMENKEASDAPVLDTVTWSPDGKQLSFVEWDILAYWNRYYGPKYVIVNVEDNTYVKYDMSSHFINKDRFIEWLNDEQNLLVVNNNSYYGIDWPLGGFNYYLFNAATGSIYPWLQDQPLDFVQVSPLEHNIIYKTVTNGVTDLMAASSFLNLVAELRIIRSNSALLLKGTANDANFEGYKLEYADIKTPSDWALLSPPSDAPVVNGTFATWVPPREGTFMLRLTVWDKAGNVASSAKKVLWNINNTTITNFFKSQDIFSPNGDGIKDTVELSYTVLQPVHLEFNVYDESDKIVKTFFKQYMEKTSDAISWDGRDESGNVVPDGKYKIKVLNFEFFTTVDTALPIVSAVISPISVDDKNSLFFVDFSALAFDKNIRSWKIEYGEGENPQEWFEYSSGSDVLAAKDSNNSIITPMSNALIQRYESKKAGNDIVWLKGKKLRITAEDFAGNRSTSVPHQLEEKVVFSYWDNLFIPLQSTFPSFANNVDGFETLHHKATNVVSQYWDGQQWHNSSPATETAYGKIGLTWNGASVPSGAVYGIRAKVVDELGSEYFSNMLPTMDLFHVYANCSDSSLRGINALLEDFVLLKLQVKSSDDGRFSDWTDFQTFDSSKGKNIPRGDFILPDPAIVTGYHYQIRMAGTKSNGTITYATPANYPLEGCNGSSAVKFLLKVAYAEAKECGQVAPGMVTLDAEFPTNMTGDVTFLTLSYLIQKAGGWQLIRTYDLRNEKWNSVILPIADLVEGEFPVKAVLAFLDKEDFNKVKEVSSSAVVKVDRTLPLGRITYPAGISTKICPVKVNGPGSEWSGIPIEAAITDNVTVKEYSLYYGAGGNPSQWYPATAPTVDGNVIIRRQITGKGTKNGNIGTWDITGLAPASYTLKIKSMDDNGNVSCTTSGVSFDTMIDIPLITADELLISPNNDGLKDEVRLSFQTDKDAKVDVKVFKLLDNGQFDSLPVRSLVSGKTYLAGLQNAVWNGKNDAGNPVPDGRYAVAVYATDICGITAMKWAGVEVDTTLPTTIIVVPNPGGPIPSGNIIEVKGTATDGHFASYTLEEGQGMSPTSWVTVTSGNSPINGAILGAWNTFGREGVWTVRLTAIDKAGNRSSTSSTVDLGVRKNLIKNFQISPRILSPNGDGKQDAAQVNYELAEAGQVKISILDAAGAIINSYSLNTSSAGSFVYDWNGKAGTNASVPVADGTYSVNLTATLSSNPSVTQMETIAAVIDTIEPIIEINHPTDKGFLNKTDIAVLGNISDPNLVSYSVKISGPSGMVMEDAGAQNRSGYTFGVLTNLAEGKYAVAVEAKDGGENLKKLVSTFTIDRTLPKVSFDTPKTNEFFGAAKKVVEITGGIVEKNLEKYSLRYGAGETPSQWIELVSGDTIPTVSKLFSWDVGKDNGVADGIYTISLYARDKAGLEGEVTAKITIDNTMPEVMITSLKDGDYVKDPVEIKGTAYDLNLDKAQLDISEGACSTAYKWTTLRSVTVPVKNGFLELWKVLPADGEYCLKLSALDKSGNKAECKTSIKVDTHPPAAPILTGKVENKTNVRLDWTLNSEPDASGYNVYRNGQKLNNIPLPNVTLTDSNLKEGSYSYVVRAVDLAGNESGPSNLLAIKIDITGPSARITSPVENGKINELVEIKGTVVSPGDFKEYRVSVGKGASPDAWSLIRKSPVPVSSGFLAQWNTSGLTEGSYLIKLEAEDLSGNVVIHTIPVIVDNTPPARPTILSVGVNGQDVNISWNSNSETDLAGYVLFRNDQPANASGLMVRNLKSYLLSGFTYIDKALPDGTYQYYLVAMDQAGNTSISSEMRQISIDTHPPHATIIEPLSGAKFEGKIAVKAESPDNDIASIQFQYRRVGETVWSNNGQPVISSPFMSYFDTKVLGLGYGQYQLQSIATDNGGKTDPSPSFITVVHTDLTAPGAPVNLQVKVNGKDVMLSWSENAETDLDGYNIYRINGPARSRINAVLVNGQTYQDNPPDGTYSYEITAVDTFANESSPSQNQTIKVFAPVLVQPLRSFSKSTVINIIGTNAGPNASVELFNQTVAGQGTAVKVIADAAGSFVAEGFPLSIGENTITARATDSAGNSSRLSGGVTIIHVVPPSPPSGLTASVEGYNATLQWDQNSESNIIGYNIYRDGQKLNLPSSVTAGITSASSTVSTFFTPSLAFDSDSSTSWLSSSNAGFFNPAWWEVDLIAQESINRVDIKWYYSLAGREFQIQAWNGSGWVTLVSISNNSEGFNSFDILPSFRTDKIRIYITQTNSWSYYKQVGIAEVTIVKESPIPTRSFQDNNLKDKIYHYTVSAVDKYGFESAPSEEIPAVVGDVVPPAAPQNVVAKVVGSDVVLDWTANAEPDVAGYLVYRNTPQRWTSVTGPTAVAGAHFVDAALANGKYTYRIYAVDAVGNQSTPSNETEAIIAVTLPTAPKNLNVTSLSEGKKLYLQWEKSEGTTASYNLYRSAAVGGPYQKINSSPLVLPSYTDTGLGNGNRYFYVVTSVDSSGNEGVYSNEASGVPVDSSAPAPPVIFSPTSHDAPVRLVRNSIDIAGYAEPGVGVQLTKDNLAVAKSTAYETDVINKITVAYSGTAYSVSPDGSLLTYYDDTTGTLSLKNISTAAVTPVAKGGSSPQWSPGGDKVAYVYGGRIGIFDRNANTSTHLTSDLIASESYPSWSKNGGKVVFISSRGGSQDVWVKDLNSDLLSQITNGINASYPSISPDETKVSYFVGQNLYVTDVQSGLSSIIDNNAYAGTNIWSPDGRNLAFISYGKGNFDIFVHDMQTLGVQQVTNTSYVKYMPVWSIDGKNIAYINGEANYTYSLMVTELGGGSRLLQGGLSYPSFLLLRVSGALSYVTGNTITTAYAKGLFSFSGVKLEAGENLFRAIAVDDSGNASGASDEISILFDLSKLPDVSISGDDIYVYPEIPKPGAELTVTAVVRNPGEMTVKSVDVGIYLWDSAGDLKLLQTMNIPELAGGAEYTVGSGLPAGTIQGMNNVIVMVDPANAIMEQLENNNFAAKEFYVTDTEEVIVTTSLDAECYAGNQDVAVNVTLQNSGMAKDGVLSVRVEDENGNSVTLLDVITATVVYGSNNFTYQWNTGTIFAGSYRVRAVFQGADGTAIENSMPFAILSDVHVNSGVITDKQEYGTSENVVVTSNLKNSGSNYVIPQLKVRARVVDSSNSTLFTEEKTIEQLFPATGITLLTQWDSGLNLPGTYRVVVETYLGDKLVSSSATQFAINPVSKVSGTVSVDSAAVLIGNNIKANFTVANSGNVGASGVIKAIVIDAASKTNVAVAEQSVTLAMNGSQSGEFIFQSQGLELKPYLVSLQFVSQGNQKNIASASFAVKDGTPPLMTILAPTAGAPYNTTIPIAALVSDNASGVERVEYQVDGAAWKLLPLVDPAQGHYAAAWEPTIADSGFHLVSFRGTDRAGNVSVPVSVRIEIQMDNVPPVSVLSIIGNAKHGTSTTFVTSATTFAVTATDDGAGVARIEYRINGGAWTPFAPFSLSREEDYTIDYRASDLAGNLETFKSFSVTVDNTSPKTSITSSDPLADGAINSISPITTFTLTATDNHSGVKDIWYRIDSGQWHLFNIGFTLAGLKAGSHVISFKSVDCVGNEEAEQSVTVLLIAFEVQRGLSPEPVILLSPWEDVDKVEADRKKARIDALVAMLDALGASFYVAKNEDDFKLSLRSGRYNTFLLLDARKKAVAEELREGIYYGDGLIYIKTRPDNDDSDLNGIFGVEYTGKTSSDGISLDLAESPLGPVDTLQGGGKAVVATVTSPTAMVYGMATDERGTYPAAVFNEYGRGRALLFTFEPALLFDKARAVKLLANSINLVKPKEHSLRAQESVPVRIEVVNSTEPFGLEMSQTIPATCTAEAITPLGDLVGNVITWRQYLGASEKAKFGYYLNLPDLKGDYTVTTVTNYANYGSYRSYDSHDMILKVGNSSDELLQKVISELFALPVSDKKEREWLGEAISELNQIRQTVVMAIDAEENVQRITRAANEVVKLAINTQAARVELDELLKIWQRKWYLLTGQELKR